MTVIANLLKLVLLAFVGIILITLPMSTLTFLYETLSRGEYGWLIGGSLFPPAGIFYGWAVWFGIF